MKDYISILMPVKNAAPFLAACLDSIIKQTCKSWELVVVDDHSDDDSLAILQDYERRDHRIKVLINEGKGIINALRRAYDHSTGEILTRMDADDIMAPNKLMILKQNLLSAGLGHLAVGGVKYFSEEPLGSGYKRYETWLNRLTLSGDNFSELYRECVIPSPCWMIHKEDLEYAGAFDDDRYPEDYDLAFRMYQSNLDVIPCDKILHHWRDHPARSSRNDKNYLDNRFLQLKCHHFMLHDYEDRTLVVWGAGKKGKLIVQHLKRHQPDLYWITDNEKKVGKDIYGVTLNNPEVLVELFLPQVIVAIANPQEQKVVEDRLFDMGLYPMVDYFMFC